MWRSIRWLDRCIAAHTNPAQSLFPIIQGGLDLGLRRICIAEMIKRDANGYAIGGLSGGESKDEFWRVVSLCTDLLPKDKPRYCMGVGYPEDLVICSALGVDMFDCVFPTRTARFGTALTRRGPMRLRSPDNEFRYSPIESSCDCEACTKHSIAYIHRLVKSNETNACHLLSVHNIRFQMRLMAEIRSNIASDTLPEFITNFMYEFFKFRPKRITSNPDPKADTEELNENDECVNGALLVANDDALLEECVAVNDEEKGEDMSKVIGSNGYPLWITNAMEHLQIELRI